MPNQNVIAEKAAFIALFPSLEEVLEQCSGTFVCAEPLAGGLTNVCYKVSFTQSCYVWRPSSNFNRKVDIDRSREKKVLDSIDKSPTDLNERCLGFNSPKAVAITGEGLLVEWLPGDLIDTDLKPNVLAKLLSKIHAIEINGDNIEAFNFGSKVEHYWHSVPNELKSSELRDLHQRFATLPISMLNQEYSNTLIHMDFGTYNLIKMSSEAKHEYSVGVIDWEYAAIGNPVIDVVFTANATKLDLKAFCADYCNSSSSINSSFEALQFYQQAKEWKPYLEFMACLWFLIGFSHYNEQHYFNSALSLINELSHTE